MSTLIGDMQTFIKLFNGYFLRENMAIGVECNQFHLGGQLIRYEYVLECMKNYAESGTAIEELEDELLLPSWEPLPEYDSSTWYDYRNISTYNY